MVDFDMFGIGETASGVWNTIGSMLGQAFSVQNMKRQFEYNKQLAKYQNDLNVENYKNRYQWAAQDAEKAGINRLYGLGQGSVSGAGLATVSQPDSSGMMNAMINANPIKAGFEIGNWIRDFNLKRAQEKEINQRTKTEEMKTQLTAYQSINQQIENLKAQKELKWYDKLVLTQLEQQRSVISANMANAIESQTRTFNIKEDTELKKEKIKTEAAAREAAERTNKWHRNHPILSEAAVTFQEMQGAIDAAEKGGKLIIDAATKGKARKFTKKSKNNIK